MILDDTLLDDLEAKAKQSPRLRMNLNLHDSLDSKAQRLLNALMPGTVIPIHRHRHTAETYAILRGRMFVVFYDSMGGAVERILLDSRSGHYGVHIPKGMRWRSSNLRSSWRSRTARICRFSPRTLSTEQAAAELLPVLSVHPVGLIPEMGPAGFLFVEIYA